MSTAELIIRLRPRLEAQLQDVIARHSKIDAHLRNIDISLPQDWRDLAQVLENDEVLAALDTQSRAEIDAIRVALHDMDEGTYGICVSCGGPIRGSRLEALPFVKTCIACAGNHLGTF